MLKALHTEQSWSHAGSYTIKLYALTVEKPWVLQGPLVTHSD